METDVNRERSKQESEGQKCRIRVDLEAVVINNWVSLFEMFLEFFQGGVLLYCDKLINLTLLDLKTLQWF